MTSFSKGVHVYVTSEGPVSQNVWYYSQLSIVCYQVSCYAKKHFEKLPIFFLQFSSVVHALSTELDTSAQSRKKRIV